DARGHEPAGAPVPEDVARLPRDFPGEQALTPTQMLDAAGWFGGAGKGELRRLIASRRRGRSRAGGGPPAVVASDVPGVAPARRTEAEELLPPPTAYALERARRWIDEVLQWLSGRVDE